jgi:hypothetical protein
MQQEWMKKVGTMGTAMGDCNPLIADRRPGR